MRDNQWLKSKLVEIWEKYFADVPRLNTVSVKFGRKAKRRLASIRQTKRHNKYSDTEINVTGFYADPIVPETVVECTLAHELCHYAHGFASPLPQYSKYPHKGDLVDNELRKRGLGDILKFQEAWLKENWNRIVGAPVFREKITNVRKARRSPASNFRKLIKLFGF